MDNLDSLRNLMQRNGVQRLYFKLLSPNDNSKNQVYFGQGFSSLNIIPVKDIVPNTATRQPGFRARLDFAWLDDNGTRHKAPKAQMVLYPQYPEVRFSGFLAGCEHAPSTLMSSREEGRILFLGVTADDMILGYVVSPESVIAQEIPVKEQQNAIGVFQQLELDQEEPYRKMLIDTLASVHRKGWIDSRRLLPDGSSIPCNAPQCGGYTLEAEFGITPNGFPRPDVWGWEIKQYNVGSFQKIDTGIVTLMTPEPTGGYYREAGVEQFIRKFGYTDMLGRPDRLNFGGIHRFGHRAARTRLTLVLDGYDRTANRIVSVNGGLVLLTDNDENAAVWHYSSLMEKWNRKHAQAAYVPSMRKKEPHLQYCYGPTVRLGTGTEFLFLLEAIAAGLVYYDPGIKLEQASSGNPVIKQRSQFRIKSRDLSSLYAKWDAVELV